jgi:cobalamin synthase
LVQDADDTSHRSDDPLRRDEVLLVCAFALAGCAPLAALAWPAGVTAALAGVVIAVLAARFAIRLLGCYTGDVAGRDRAVAAWTRQHGPKRVASTVSASPLAARAPTPAKFQ